MEINRPKKGRKYVYVLDFEDGRVYRYDMWLNDSEEIENYLTDMGHQPIVTGKLISIYYSF